MKRRVFTLVLSLITLLGMLAACAAPDQGEQDTQSNQEEMSGDVYEQALANLTVDMKGDDFVVLGRGDMGNSVTEIFREETSTDPLEDAVYQRNLGLSEACKVNYIARLVAGNDIVDAISTDIKSGSGEYDIAFPEMRQAGAMATQTMLTDFHSLTYVDLDADWWDQGTRAMSIAGKTLWMNSDINFMAHDVTFLIMFSKVMAEQQNLDNLYETVENQEWTMDVFSSYAKKVSSDADGNGKYDENDNYGLIGTSSLGFATFYASGLRFAACDEDGEPYLAMTNSDLIKASDLLDKVLDLLYTGHSTYIVAPGKEQVAKEMFSKNQGLFYVECAGYIVGLRHMSDDFGVLPMPKYDKAQKDYSTFTSVVGSTMVVPQGAKNFEDMSKVIETMAVLSGKSVIPTYYDLVLKRKTIRDEESAGMLDIIFSNRIYDLANYYEKLGLMYLFQTSVDQKNTSFSSKYSSAVKKAEKELIRIVNRIEDIE